MLPFGGQHDNEHVLRGMKWADNYWLFSDNRERLICMVSDIIEKLMVLEMEPKAESLWWTSTYKGEKSTVGEVFDVLGYRFHRDGKGFQGDEPCAKGLRRWRDKYIYRSTVPMTAKCKRVHAHVYSTVLNGSINWHWSGAINKVRAWEATYSPSDLA